MMINQINIGERLKTLRKQRNLTRKELTENLNNIYDTRLDEDLILRWENGYPADPKSILVISSFFNVTINDLVEFNNLPFEQLSAEFETTDLTEHDSSNQFDNKNANVLSKLLTGNKRIKETHTRKTYMIRNDLIKRLDDYADMAEIVGFKTKFINTVIEQGLNELDRQTQCNKK